MSDNCVTCGARPRHQRLAERECPNCGDLFDVLTEWSQQTYCDRACQLTAYNEQRRLR